MSLPTKSAMMWLLLLAAMTANGFFRVLVLQPRLGEHQARQLASVLGVCIILTLAALFVQRLADPTAAQLVGIGALWVGLTVAFELVFGRYVSGLSWEALLADYDVTRGRLWPLVLLTTLLAPWFWGVAAREEAR